MFTLYQFFIYETQTLLQLQRFWNTLKVEVRNEGPYKASIGSMKLNL